VLVTTRAQVKRNSRSNTRTLEGDLDSLDNATDLTEDTNEGETDTDFVNAIKRDVRSCQQTKTVSTDCTTFGP